MAQYAVQKPLPRAFERIYFDRVNPRVVRRNPRSVLYWFLPLDQTTTGVIIEKELGLDKKSVGECNTGLYKLTRREINNGRLKSLNSAITLVGGFRRLRTCLLLREAP